MPIHDHEPTTRGRTFLWAGIAAGALFLVVLLTHGFGWLASTGKDKDGPPLMLRRGDQIIVPEGSALRSRLTLAPVTLQATSGKLRLPAVVESDPARTAAVLAPLGGRVVALEVTLGERVARDQLLALLDSADLAQAYGDDDKAAATLQLAAKNLSRQVEQNRIGAASDRDLDQARSDHAQAQAEYTRTQARLRALGVRMQAGAPATHLLEVRAPVAGSITSLSVTPGTLVNDPTQALMNIADLGTVWVTAMVPEKDVGSVARNQEADVSVDAWPGRQLHGKVLFVSDVIDPDTRRARLRIAFANADYSLKPNMFATVTLQGPSRPRVVLPSSALLMNNNRVSVFVATAPWTFERRAVESELEEGTSVVIGSGLAAGEQVVVSGGILLND